jgi:iron(III) transport system ATP-binding protein
MATRPWTILPHSCSPRDDTRKGTSTAVLSITRLSKRFEIPGGFVGAVQDLELEVAEGEFFVLLGPSGCGKTTLMRCVAGLERPEQGQIHLGDTLLSSVAKKVFVEPEDRDIAMVFQSYAIWPHMSVFENVAFPLTEAKKRRVPAREVAAKVGQVLQLVRLEGFENHASATLSGGQQQRVALARALIREPKLLLMDEPLSNLDAKLREEMRDEIKDLTRSLGVTTIHVTHDQVEGLALADRLAVMRNGVILQLGRPEDLYRQPGSRIVAEFLGRTNWLEGTVRSAGSVECSIGLLQCSVPPSLAVGSRVSLGVRPEWIELRSAPTSSTNCLSGRIESRMFLGEASVYKVSVGEVVFQAKADANLPAHGPIQVVLPPEKCVLFPSSEADAAVIEADRGHFGAAALQPG